ncbi:proteasome assembly chaperone 4 isoform 2-T2 [Erethizon dorsatum]
MEEPRAAAGGDVSLHNFSARLWEQLVHFHVMRLTDSLFLWVGATPDLRNLAVAMCSRYDPIPVCTSLFGNTSDTTSTGLAQRLGRPASRCLSAITFRTQTVTSPCS